MFNSQAVWIGISNVNTFSTAAAIAFASDEKTLPFSALFGFTAITTDAILCFKPDHSTTLPDVIGEHLIDEFIPGHGFKSQTLKEFLKYGVRVYDN